MIRFWKSFSSFFLVILLSACTGDSENNSQESGAMKTAPSFSVSNLKGGQLSLEDYKDKVVLINFWATWCAPCKEEIPDFVEVYNDLSDKGFVVLGIALDNKALVSEFAKKLNITYPIAYGEDDVAKVNENYGNTLGALPYNVILNKQHKIVYAQPGPIPKARLLKLIAPLL